MSDESGVRRALAGDDVLSVIRAAFTDQGEPVASLWAELEQSDALRASLLVDVWVLSPLSVVPDRQGSGVGTRVLAAALDEASVGNTPLLFLEVDPGYYGARGFERASEHGFAAPRLRGAAGSDARRDRGEVGMKSEIRDYRTGGDEVVLDITDDCAGFVDGEGDGLLQLFVPHATLGIAVIETGSGSDDDLLAALGDLLPADGRWRHQHGSPGHGRSHVMPALLPPYATVPVIDGRLALGTWQSICLVDLNVDNPDRQVRFSFLTG